MLHGKDDVPSFRHRFGPLLIAVVLATKFLVFVGERNSSNTTPHKQKRNKDAVHVVFVVMSTELHSLCASGTILSIHHHFLTSSLGADRVVE